MRRLFPAPESRYAAAVALENVDRIAPPSVEDFHRDYVRAGRPCIIQGLFDGAPLRALDDAAAAARGLWDVPLEIQPNYITFLETGQRGVPRAMTLAGYLSLVEGEPRTRDLCVEYPTPAELLGRLPPPPHCERYGLGDTVSATFVANRGNYNHLHFDDDQRDVLLYQVFGRKRFAVIAPEDSRKLDAYVVLDPQIARGLASVPARDANGRVFLEHMSEDDKDAFLQYVGAHDCTLEPGETLFMPRLAWHYVEYLDTAMSVTYRLGRGTHNRMMAEVMPFPDGMLQAVGCRFRDEPFMRREHGELVASIEQACTLEGADDPANARHAALSRALRTGYEELYGQSAASVEATRALHHRALCAAYGDAAR